MNSKVFYYFLIGVLVVAATLGLVGFYYVAFGNLSGLLPPQFRPVTSPKNTALQTPPSTDPQINLSVDKNGRLVLTWKNLRSGMRDIHIFRAREGQPRWSLWKTISVSNLAEGLIQLQATYSQGLLGYVYRFEAVGADGGIVWSSPPTSITGGDTTPAPNTNQTPSSGGGNPSSGNTSPSPQSSSTTTNTPSSTSVDNSTSTVIYYTPQGEVSGSSTLSVEQFWAKEVNKKIQIGWSHLNTSSVAVEILRAVNGNGPWTVFFHQSQPVANQPYSLSFVDDAVSQTAFYKLNSFSSSGSILDTYGPVIFQPSGL
ncbi:MAG: hypothetical protein AAB903_02395 [Patescibacteria group bacterium]